MKLFKIALLLSIGAMIIGACTWFTDFTVEEGMQSSGMIPFIENEDVRVTGTVTGTVDDCAFDGNCALVLDVEGSEVIAIWAEGMIRCEGQYQDGLINGDLVEAFGIARNGNSLSICPSPSYYIQSAN